MKSTYEKLVEIFARDCMGCDKDNKKLIEKAINNCYHRCYDEKKR